MGCRKPGNGSSSNRGGRARPATPNAAAGFAPLEQTRVYRHVPIDVRAKLDALLMRDLANPTLADEVANALDLTRRYGIRQTDVRLYQQRLEAFVRPILASAAVSALLSALPRRIVRGLGRANRILIWSRLVQQLADPHAERLSTSEFTKLAAMLRPTRTARRRRARSTESRRTSPGLPARDEPISPERLASLVRSVYGVNFATDSPPGDA